jgi:hypothetical protein
MIYDGIYYEIEGRFDYYNEKLNIDFTKLETFYVRNKDFEDDLYIPIRNKEFIEKQYKLLNKLNTKI